MEDMPLDYLLLALAVLAIVVVKPLRKAVFFLLLTVVATAYFVLMSPIGTVISDPAVVYILAAGSALFGGVSWAASKARGSR